VAFVIADGLSALAVHQNAVPLIEAMTVKLQAVNWRVAPIMLVEQGRVAIGDEIGELLGVELVAVLIGERPGLSSPDSLGIYLSYQPRVGMTDAERNCISNVRPAGLSYATAAHKLFNLMSEARRRRLSGVRLKDEGYPGSGLRTKRMFRRSIRFPAATIFWSMSQWLPPADFSPAGACFERTPRSGGERTPRSGGMRALMSPALAPKGRNLSRNGAGLAR